MKTAEEIWDEYSDNMESVSDINHYAIIAMKEYAQEAIKADRENVVKNSRINWLDYDEAEVDKDSIINAPNIELK